MQLQIAPTSGVGSLMSVTKTTDDEEGEEDDDDNFQDTMSLIEGNVPGAQTGQKTKTGGIYIRAMHDLKLKVWLYKYNNIDILVANLLF